MGYIRKNLAIGSLGWLIQQMPKIVRHALRDELAAIDDQQRERFRTGQQPHFHSLTAHLRQVTEQGLPIVEMKVSLKVVLDKYIPLPDDIGLSGQVPTLAECVPLWQGIIERKLSEPQTLEAA